MLRIRGVLVGIDDQILVRVFGRSDQRNERLGRWIAEMIEDSCRVYDYSSAASMQRAFLQANIHNRYLTILFEHPSIPAVNIIMTGNRARDESEANRLSKLSGTPQRYTWHHCENIVSVGNGYSCRMILIQTWYHQQWHTGGVHEYELLTNTVYR